MTIRLVALVATAFACLSPAQAQQREPVQVRISYAGLDLSKPEGRRILDARIDRAALSACHSKATGLHGRADERQCRTEMRNDGQVRVAQIRPVAVASVK